MEKRWHWTGCTLLMSLLAMPLQTVIAGIEWQDPVRVAEGEAHQGPWRMNDSDFRYVDDPTVAINDEGVIAVAWADQSEQDLFFQLFGPDGEARMEEPVNISASPDIFSWLPRIAIGEGEAPDVFVLWQEIVFSGGSHGGEIFFSRSTDGGHSFDDARNLSRTEAGAGKGRLSARSWQNGSLDLVRDHEGILHVAWTEYEGRLHYARSTDEGEDFSDPVHVHGDDDRPARAPSLAVDSEGIVYLAWTTGDDPEADILLTRSTDEGESFSEPRAPVGGSGHADAPVLLTEDGKLHLAWAESAAGPRDRYGVYFSSADTEDLEFGEARRISEPAPEDHFDQAHFPHLASDGEGTVHVLWEVYPENWQRPLALAHARGQGTPESFSDPSLVPGTGTEEVGAQGGLQGLLMRKLAVNSEGRVAVVNSSWRRNEQSSIQLLIGRP